MASADELEAVTLGIAAGGQPTGELRLLGVQGRERISTLFSFDLFFSRDTGPLSPDELDALFSSPCAIALGTHPHDVVRGVLERVHVLESGDTKGALYVARLVPTVSLLTHARTNRVFQNMTVLEIVASVLARYQLVPERDYRILARAKYPKREYVVQYEESDWDFVQRWLEHEGIAYWFEHADQTDVLVVCDGAHGAPPIAEPTVIPYRAKKAGPGSYDVGVTEWSLVQQRTPARVALYDYNYRTPHARLVARAPVDETRGFGTVMRYGDHFKHAGDGGDLAKVRAEALACQRRVFSGTTDCPKFRVGHAFELCDARDPADDRKYLITEIEHAVGEAPPDLPPAAHTRLSSRFRAIPIDVPFRPPLVTPRSRIHGVMNGIVAGDGKGQFAEIDELGRYKVTLPFDSGPAKGLGASRWIRMAQPSSGPGYGSHHPLHKGVEVLVAFVDGDPDRPVIVGSVPNPANISPSIAQNATQTVTRTAAGIHFELEDLATGASTAAGGKR